VDLQFGHIATIEMLQATTRKVLVVSSNLSLREAAPRVLCAPIYPVNPKGAVPLFTEPIAGIGVAVLDLLFSYPREHFLHHDGELDPSRHEDVGRRVRYLVGP
jgi:hypothetical protein